MTSGGKLEFSRGLDELDDGPAENQSQRLINLFPNFQTFLESHAKFSRLIGTIGGNSKFEY